MQGITIRSLLVAFCVLIASTAAVRADGSGGDGGGDNKTETEAQTEAKLLGAGAQTAAKGYAESTVITITDKTTNTTTTSSCLTVSVKGLTLADASVVTIQLNNTTIGTGTVKSGRASLRLSSKKGGTVPTVAAGDTLTVLDPVGTNVVDLTGTFGPITTHSGN